MVKIPYQIVVGSLMHVTVNTWLDIAYAISSIAQYLSNVGKKPLACSLKNNEMLETKEVSV